MITLKSGKTLCKKNKGATFSLKKKVINIGGHFYTNDIHYNKCITVKAHARIISDGLKIRENLVQKNKGATFSLKKSYQFREATFHMNNIHYNKCIIVKTHARISSDGLTIRESPLPRNREATIYTNNIVKVANAQQKCRKN